MSDLHEIFLINDLTNEQAKALASVVESQNGGDATTGTSPFLTLIGVVVAVLASACIAGLLWLFSGYSTLGERVTKIESGQSKILEKLEAIDQKITPIERTQK